MSKSLNKVMLIGNVTREPDIRVTAGGTKVANFTIATNEKWKDRNGQEQEHSEFTRVTIFGGTAEVVEKYVSKGTRLYVEGRLRTEKWQDRDGNDRYTTEVRAHSVILLDGGGIKPDPNDQHGVSDNYGGSPDLSDDDLPF